MIHSCILHAAGYPLAPDPIFRRMAYDNYPHAWIASHGEPESGFVEIDIDNPGRLRVFTIW